MPGRTLAVVLAAGAGRRFEAGGHKLLADLDGRPVLRWAVDAALAADIGPVAVMVPPGPAGAVVAAAVRDLADAGSVVALTVPDAAAGLARSLRTGIAHAVSLGADTVVVGLGDMPLVAADAWAAVAAADPPAGVVVTARYRSRRGPVRCPPVRLDRSVWGLLPTDGDEGARAVLRTYPELVVEVEVAGDPLDVDRLGDLDAARRAAADRAGPVRE